MIHPEHGKTHEKENLRVSIRFGELAIPLCFPALPLVSMRGVGSLFSLVCCRRSPDKIDQFRGFRGRNSSAVPCQEMTPSFMKATMLNNSKHTSKFVSNHNVGDIMLFLEALVEMVDRARSDRVQSRVRFIVEDADWFFYHRAGKRYSLAFPERSAAFFFVLAYARFPMPASPEDQFRPVTEPCFAEGEGNILTDGQGVKKGAALEHHADLLADGPKGAFREPGNVLAFNQDRAFPWLQKAAQMLDEHALPPRPAKQAEGLPGKLQITLEEWLLSG